MEKIEISGVGKWLGRFKGEREGVEMELVVPSEFDFASCLVHFALDSFVLGSFASQHFPTFT